MNTINWYCCLSNSFIILIYFNRKYILVNYFFFDSKWSLILASVNNFYLDFSVLPAQYVFCSISFCNFYWILMFNYIVKFWFVIMTPNGQPSWNDSHLSSWFSPLYQISSKALEYMELMNYHRHYNNINFCGFIP